MHEDDSKGNIAKMFPSTLNMTFSMGQGISLTARVWATLSLELCVTHIFGALLLLKKMQRFLASALGWGSRNVGAPLAAPGGVVGYGEGNRRVGSSSHAPIPRAQRSGAPTAP